MIVSKYSSNATLRRFFSPLILPLPWTHCDADAGLPGGDTRRPAVAVPYNSAITLCAMHSRRHDMRGFRLASKPALQQDLHLRINRALLLFGSRHNRSIQFGRNPQRHLMRWGCHYGRTTSKPRVVQNRGKISNHFMFKLVKIVLCATAPYDTITSETLQIRYPVMVSPTIAQILGSANIEHIACHRQGKIDGAGLGQYPTLNKRNNRQAGQRYRDIHICSLGVGHFATRFPDRSMQWFLRKSEPLSQNMENLTIHAPMLFLSGTMALLQHIFRKTKHQFLVVRSVGSWPCHVHLLGDKYSIIVSY
jgi:hypothetical protein